MTTTNRVFLIILTLLPSSLWSQHAFIKAFDSPEWSLGACVVSTKDGGFLIGDSELSGSGFWGFYPTATRLIRVDKDRDTLWTVSPPVSGGILAATETKDKGFAFTTFNNVDIEVVKTDSAGTVEWLRNFPDFGPEVVASSIIQTKDKGYIIGASREDPGPAKAIIFKVDEFGNPQWFNKDFNAEGWDPDNRANPREYVYPRDDSTAVFLSRGNQFITIDRFGHTLSAVPIPSHWQYKMKPYGETGYVVLGTTFPDGLISRLDLSGAVQWSVPVASLPGSRHYFQDVVTTRDGSIYVVAHYKNSWPLLNRVMVLIKFSPFGNEIWRKTIDDPFRSFIPYAMSETVDRGVIITGQLASGQDDPFLVRVTKNGSAFLAGVRGGVFRDWNGDGINQPGEEPIAGVLLRSMPSERIAYSTGTGEYEIGLDLGDSSAIEAVGVPLYHSVSAPLPLGTYDVVADSVGVLNGMHFALYPTPGINDLCLTMTSIGFPRPGWDLTFYLTVTNVGTTIADTVNLEFEPFPSLTHNSSLPPFDSVGGGIYHWQVGPISPGGSETVTTVFTIPTTTPLGTILDHASVVGPSVTDANPDNNGQQLTQTVIGSFDPNDKLADPAGVGPDGWILPEDLGWITYTVRFQNTGTDTAFNVYIKDHIDENLDLTSFQMLDASDGYSVAFEDERSLVWTFANILLPDSNVNEPESHGFVKFRIHTVPAIGVGDVFSNYASIVFDYNEPVITNTVQHTVTLCPEVSGLSVEAAEDDAVLRWTGAPGLQDSVQVFLSPADSTGQVIFIVTGDSLWLEHLEIDVVYTAILFSYCGDSSLSEVSSVSFETMQEPVCTAPVLDHVTADTTFANLIWSPVAHGTTYRVIYRLEPSGPTDSVETTASELHIDGLLPDRDYAWQVRALCDSIGLSSAPSDWDLFHTLALPVDTGSGSTGLEPLVDAGLQLFPNPTTDEVVLLATESLSAQHFPVQWHLFDTQGRMMMQGELNGKASISVEALDPGIYRIEIQQKDRVISGSFVKQ